MKIELDDNLKNWSKYARVYDPIKCASIDGTDCEPHDRAVIRALNSTYKPNRFVKGRPECTIFVSRLNHETSKDTIKDIFSKYGKLKRFRMVKDIVTGMPKGYAFVEYEEEQAAEEAYRVTNRMVVDGNAIFVDFECERLLKGWKPRRLGGGIAGKKESGQLRFGGRDRPFKKPIALELKEKEENRLRERRAREEDRRRGDKSRDSNRKKSPRRENRIGSPSLSRKKIESTKAEDKRPPSPNVKKVSGSPPRKVSRRHSPSKVNRNPPRRSPHREKINDRVLTREKPRSNSPLRKKDNRTSPLRQNGKQYSFQEKYVKPKSPVHENFKPKSPTSENTRKKSPFRKLIRDSSKNVAPGKSESRSPSQRAHYPSSPLRQNGRDQSPLERHSKHSPPRDRIRRRSPMLDKVKYSPERDTDKKLPPLSRREKNRSRSPPQSNTKYTAISRDGDRYIRHESPSRKPRLQFPGREDDIRRSPLGSPVPNFASARGRQSSPKRSPLNRPYSPRHGKDSREYRFPRTEHRSPGRRTPPRDIKRQYSPPKQDISGRHLGGDSIGYHESLKGSSYQQTRCPRGDSHSPIFKRERRSASAEYFPREHRVHSPRHEHGRQSPYKEYSQPPPLSGDSHVPYHYENQYGHSDNGPKGREFPPTQAEFRQHSPPRVDFRQPPPSFEQPRQYSSFQDNTHFPPPTRDYPPPRADEPFRDSHPARDFPQRGAHPHRDVYPSKETTGEFCPSDQTEYFSHPRQDERKHFPLVRDEGRHHESRQFEEFPYHHSNLPPMRGGRKFPSSRENADAFEFGRGRGHRFSRQRGGPRGGRGGFRPY